MNKLSIFYIALPFLLSACFTNSKESSDLANADPTQNTEIDQPHFHLDELCLAPESQDEWEALQLWDRIRLGYSLPEQNHARIESELRWFLKHPEYIKRVSERGSRYWFHIVNELERRNMPLELAFLPIVESGFDPFAYSPGRASGLWQIIPGTAKELGLKNSWWYDGRRDAIASTDAALTYLQSLHKRFDGEWLHAVAAYNSGGGRVSRAIKKNEKLGKPTDFWNLKLPKETQAYVPRMLALAKLYKDPSHYKLNLIALENAPVFAEVEIQEQIDLALAAEIADMSMDEFYQLNPAFNRWATDPNGPHKLLIPIDKVAAFKTKLDQLPKEQWLSWKQHTIKNGETLSHIAKKYSVSVSSIQSANKIRGSNIRAGKRLLIPNSSKTENFYSLSADQRLAKKQNAPANKHKNKHVYVVKSGDSFWKIARQFSVSTHQIAKWNNLSPKDILSVGKKLVIWTDNTSISSATQSGSVIRKLSYKVRSGDSLAKIAQKFKVSLNDLIDWNQINKEKYLQPGQALVLFVNVKG